MPARLWSHPRRLVGMLIVALLFSVSATAMSTAPVAAATATNDRQAPICNPWEDPESGCDPVTWCEANPADDDCGMTPEDYAATKAELDADPDLTVTGDQYDGYTYTDSNGDAILSLGPTVFDAERENAYKLGVTVGGCGFLQVCLFFSRTAQQYIITAGLTAAEIALCKATGPLVCVISGAVVATVLLYITLKGGICSASKPKLAVRMLPTIKVKGCQA
jgi:hypothetical protein